MAREFNDMCDLLWWEELNDEEKDEYCQEHYGVTFAEWWEEVIHPTVGCDPVTHEFYAL